MNIKKLSPIITTVVILALVPLSCNSAYSAELISGRSMRLLGTCERTAPSLIETPNGFGRGNGNAENSLSRAGAYPALNQPHRSSLFREFGSDFRSIAGDPAFYLLIGGLATVPSFLSYEDPEINEAWAGNAQADHVFELGNTMGNALLPITVSGLALAYGHLAHRPGASDFGSDLLRAQAINGVLTLSLKGITNRRRPDGTRYSFPSGHTSVTFTTAAVIYRHYGMKWGLPAAVAASYVGLSRLQENKHYLSDVVAGAVLGGYIGLKVAGRHESDGTVNIAPMIGTTYGIAATIRF
jgi:membrane-associated phospholipid phosphatase